MNYEVKRKVISFGGSIFYDPVRNKVNVSYCQDFARLVQQHQADYFIVVMGGGDVARRYIEAGKSIGFDRDGLDLLGIDFTRINARFLALYLSIQRVRARFVANLFEEHISQLDQYQVIITGGTIPGQTTDRVAVKFAAKYGNKNLINVTTTGGIYDDDPKRNDAAKLIRQINGSKVIKKWGIEHVPGMNLPIEPRAVKEALEEEVTIHVIGNSMEDLTAALYNGNHRGTIILPY